MGSFIAGTTPRGRNCGHCPWGAKLGGHFARSPTHRAMKNENRIERETVIHTQVAAAREGRDPRVIARLYSGWAVFGEKQFLRGYALLLPDPVVPALNALGAQERTGFLLDMARLGDALLKVTGAVRVNYTIFGDVERAL